MTIIGESHGETEKIDFPAPGLVLSLYSPYEYVCMNACKRGRDIFERSRY